MASVSVGSTSTRRTWPFTVIETSRSTPAAVCAGSALEHPAPKYESPDTVTPEAITPLMKSRRDQAEGPSAAGVRERSAGSAEAIAGAGVRTEAVPVHSSIGSCAHGGSGRVGSPAAGPLGPTSGR